MATFLRLGTLNTYMSAGLPVTSKRPLSIALLRVSFQ